MTIAILGWGSLLSDPGTLKIELGMWYKDGPMLPVEFARISSDKRLTLVIHPGSEDVRTYYAVSKYNKLDAAIMDLAERERTARRLENIGYMNFVTGEIRSKKMSQEMETRLLEWNETKVFDAVIWTDLDENFNTAMRKPFSLANAIEHLKSLDTEQLEAAKRYIMDAPAQTQTTNRQPLTVFLNT